MPSVMPKDLTSPMRMKKIFVSGALLIEQYTQSLVERHGKSNEGGTSVRQYKCTCVYVFCFMGTWLVMNPKC